MRNGENTERENPLGTVLGKEPNIPKCVVPFVSPKG